MCVEVEVLHVLIAAEHRSLTAASHLIASGSPAPASWQPKPEAHVHVLFPPIVWYLCSMSLESGIFFLFFLRVDENKSFYCMKNIYMWRDTHKPFNHHF